MLTPLSASVLAAPSPVAGADGRMHLAYELQLINQTPLSVTVAGVQARASGRAIGAALSGRRLAQVLAVAGSGPGVTLGAGRAGLLFMDVAYPPGRRTPRLLTHAFSLTARDPSRRGGPVQRFRFTGVPTAVGQRTAVNVEPPLRGPNWVVANGCCDAITSHRGATLPIDGTVRVPERFAIDFVQLDAQSRLANGPLQDLASYPFFGDPIYSVAAGRVVGARDGLPEQVPGRLPAGATIQTAGGNYVVVDIGGGHYAFYAHMQPGSLRVRVGDRVRAGQVLGLLGNTGNTDAPHLHFHIMDSPSPLQSNGLPFTFTSFTGAGRVRNTAAIVTGAAAQVDPRALAGPHRGVLPLNDELIDFGG